MWTANIPGVFTVRSSFKMDLSQDLGKKLIFFSKIICNVFLFLLISYQNFAKIKCIFLLKMWSVCVAAKNKVSRTIILILQGK